MSIKIILADDHRVMREGLRALLENEQDLQVIAEAGDGRTTIKLVHKLSPDLVVMDNIMPDLNGIEATRQIIAKNPRVKIIALSMHSNRRFVIEMLKAGASGYMLKDCAFEELINAIRFVLKGELYISPEIASVVLKDYMYKLPKDKSSVFLTLTNREREVLQLIAEGKATKVIAHHLGVSVKTIETHRQQIMNKLEIHSIAGLTKCAIREGLTSLES